MWYGKYITSVWKLHWTFKKKKSESGYKISIKSFFAVESKVKPQKFWEKTQTTLPHLMVSPTFNEIPGNWFLIVSAPTGMNGNQWLLKIHRQGHLYFEMTPLPLYPECLARVRVRVRVCVCVCVCVCPFTRTGDSPAWQKQLRLSHVSSSPDRVSPLIWSPPEAHAATGYLDDRQPFRLISPCF